MSRGPIHAHALLVASIATAAALAGCGAGTAPLAGDAAVERDAASDVDAGGDGDADADADGDGDAVVAAGELRCAARVLERRVGDSWVAEGDCTAVTGRCRVDGWATPPPILRWDGADWGAGSACLPGMPIAVTGHGPDEVWLLMSHGLWRWDGEVWTEEAKLIDLWPAGLLRSEDGDLWIFGYHEYNDTPAIVRRHGATWTDESPQSDGPGHVNAMHEASDGTLWAVGSMGALRWVAGAWEPTGAPSDGELSAVFAAAADDAWAIDGTELVHWDGASWASWPVVGADAYPFGPSPPAFTGFDRDDIWATGRVHWDGADWSLAAGEGTLTAYYPLESGELLGLTPHPGCGGWGATTRLYRFDGSTWASDTGAFGEALSEVEGDYGRMWGSSDESIWLIAAELNWGAC